MNDAVDRNEWNGSKLRKDFVNFEIRASSLLPRLLKSG